MFLALQGDGRCSGVPNHGPQLAGFAWRTLTAWCANFHMGQRCRLREVPLNFFVRKQLPKLKTDGKADILSGEKCVCYS